MLAERIDDGALLRLLRKWLKAGVLDTDGTVLHPVTGTPQGHTHEAKKVTAPMVKQDRSLPAVLRWVT